ncbi:MAG: ATP-binding cassette domain-containing protein [Phascolarctobacterium faecium]
MLLNITALTKTYTISGKLITALNTVDLTFSENSFTCIVGKSGCGKTTLLGYCPAWNLPLLEPSIMAKLPK